MSTPTMTYLALDSFSFATDSFAKDNRNCSRHILFIRVHLKIGVEFGLNLGMLYSLGLDKYPYRIFHNKYELYLIIMFGTKI